MAGSVALTLRNDGRFSPVRVAYRTKYVDSNAHGASASPHACLRYTSGAMAGADKGGAKRVARVSSEKFSVGSTLA